MRDAGRKTRIFGRSNTTNQRRSERFHDYQNRVINLCTIQFKGIEQGVGSSLHNRINVIALNLCNFANRLAGQNYSPACKPRRAFCDLSGSLLSAAVMRSRVGFVRVVSNLSFEGIIHIVD